MFAPAVNVLDSISIDSQIVNSLAIQLSDEKTVKHARLVLACLFIAVLASRRKQSPGQAMQNLECMRWLCAVGILLPALSPFVPGKTIPVARLALHLVILAGFSGIRLDNDKSERLVITDYMYRLLGIQHLTSLMLLAAPLLGHLLPKQTAPGACVFCGCRNMVRRQKLSPCSHYCCYVCSGNSAYCGHCGSRIESYIS